MELRQILEEAWQHARRMYSDGRLNSERTLQAVLHARISANLPDAAYAICEPRIDGLENYEAVYPDILVAQGNEVVAAIELKFVPHYRPLFQGDLEKLVAYGSASHSFPLLLHATNGKYSDARFSFSSQCLLVFGVFGRHDSEAVDPELLSAPFAKIGLQHRFLPLVNVVVP